MRNKDQERLGSETAKLSAPKHGRESARLRERAGSRGIGASGDSRLDEAARGVCLEGLGEWCIAYHYHQARTFWTFRPSGFEYCTDPDQLAARLETARHLFGLIGGQLSR